MTLRCPVTVKRASKQDGSQDSMPEPRQFLQGTGRSDGMD